MLKLLKNKQVLVDLTQYASLAKELTKLDYTKAANVQSELLAYELIDRLAYTPN